MAHSMIPLTGWIIFACFAGTTIGLMLAASALIEWLGRQYQVATDGYAAALEAATASAMAYADDPAGYMVGMAESELLAADAGRIMERADLWARRLAPWVLPDDRKDADVYHRQGRTGRVE